MASRKAFVVGLCLCYFAAFASSFVQYPGLFRKGGGITPMSLSVLNTAMPDNNLDVDWVMFGVHLAGMLVSLLIASGIALSPNAMIVLPALYWYLTAEARRSGAPFFNYQWDSLLIEVGVVGFPWVVQTASKQRPSEAARAALAGLGFKLMFSSGVVKITSGDPTWYKLRALDYHFASQPLPTPFAWYTSQLPSWALAFGTGMSLWMEICWAILILVPATLPRALGALANIVLMVTISITGNYNYFNLLTAVLLIPLIDDELINRTYKFTRSELLWSIVSAVILFAMTQAIFVVDPSNMEEPVSTIPMHKISTIPMHKMNHLLDDVVPFTYGASFLLVFFGIYSDVRTSLSGESNRSVALSVIIGVASIFLVAMCSIPMVFSLMSDRPTVDLMVPDVAMTMFFSFGQTFSSSYGLFRSITGVGNDGKVRVPVVLIELVDPTSQESTRVQLKYFISGESSVPGFVQPHQPRLDWQLWFAALVPPQRLTHEAWFWSFCDKLLQGDRAIWNLLSPEMASVRENISKFDSFKVLRAEYDFSKNWTDNNWWRLASGSTPKAHFHISRRRNPATISVESSLISNWIDYGHLLPSTLFFLILTFKLLRQEASKSRSA